MKGLIVLEGLDATGKTSAGKRLVEMLKEHGINAVYNKTKNTLLTRTFPNGPMYLLEYLIDEIRVIRPAIKQSLVIQDRYYYTVMSYNAALTSSRRLHFARPFFSKPDKVFYLTADDNVREQRWIASGRQGFSGVFHRPGLADKMDYEYKKLLPKDTIYIDTTHLTVDQVAHRLFDAIM